MEADSEPKDARSAGAVDDGPRSDAAGPRPAPGGRRSPAGARKWAFRLVAMTVIPAAFFLLLELVLRLLGVGYETRFFLRQAGTAAWVTNQRFAWRFFPPTGVKPPLPARLAAAEPPGTVRVFVFGGSAAMGPPEPAFGFARILEVMLAERLPGARVEVINTAMEGMNSHVAREIARECPARGPDLFVIYMGHNEIVGPYGVSDAYGKFTPSLGAIRASLWVRSTRTGQLVRRALRGLGGGPEPVWKGMETFVGNYVPADDPRLPQAGEHLRRNVLDILAEARGCGAPAIVCTVASNLRDCAPFMSLHRPHLAEKDKARWQALYDEAVAAARAGEHALAVAKLQAAAAIDDRFADLHFRLAGSLLAAGDAEAARRHFLLARDLDALRVRADTRTNAVLREVAGRADAFVDAEKLFAQHPRSAHGLPGEGLLLDHVHLNFEGNYALAEAVFQEASRLLARRMGLPATGPATAPAAASPARCREALALTGWDRYKIAQAVSRQVALPPFTAQLDHGDRLAGCKAEVDRLRLFASPEAREPTFAIYRKALEGRPKDLLLRGNYALCLYGFGDHAGAEAQWRELLQELPDNAEFAKQLGVALLQQGKFAQAVEQFRASLDVLPRDLNARNNLGAALLWQGKPDEAMECFQEVLRASPAHADARTNLAIALARKGRDDEAARQFEEVLRQSPDHLGALRNYARLLAKKGRLDEAVDRYRKAIAKREEYAHHLDLGGLLIEQKRPDEALVHYRRAVELGPHVAATHLALGQALLERRDYAKAAESLETALRLDENLAEAQRDLAVVLQRTGHLGLATNHYARAVALRPDDWATRERLAYALLLQRNFPEAVAQYKQVLAARNDRAEAHNNLAVALTKLGKEDEAILHFAAAVKLEPNALRHYNLATRLVRHGQDRDAIRHFRQALEMKPAWPECMGELAWVLATSDDEKARNAGEAVRLARRACEMTGGKQADIVDSLAAALAEAGQFDQAVATAEAARKLALAAGYQQMADRIAKRVELYKARKPCRRGTAEEERGMPI